MTMFPAASAQMINVFSCWLFQCPNTHSTRLPPNIILTLLFSLPVLWIRYNLFLSLLPVCVRSLSWLQLPCGWPVWVGHPLKTQQHPISLKVDYGATRLHLIYFMSLCTHKHAHPSCRLLSFPFFQAPGWSQRRQWRWKQRELTLLLPSCVDGWWSQEDLVREMNCKLISADQLDWKTYTQGLDDL